MKLYVIGGKAKSGKTTFGKFIKEELKKNGYWIIGLELDGTIDFTEQDYHGNIAVVVGSEGKGISRLVKENCDILVKIPMFGKVNSLNASVSAGLILYDIVRNRKV